MADSKPIVRVRNLSYSFGEGEAETKVLHDNNLEVLPGEVVIMTGKSGSGKTTLLTLLGALRRLQEGEIDIIDRTLTADSTPAEMVEVRRRIGFIFQAHNLFKSLTALQNVRMGLELVERNSRAIEQRALEVLARLGLHSDDPDKDRVYHKPESLSGGQNQRVAIARAIAHRPRLILADEPTAALDQQAGFDVVNLFNELATKDGCTIFIVTHDNRIVDFAHRFIGMEFGRIKWNKRKDEVHEISMFLSKVQAFSKMLEGKVTTTGTLADIAVRVQLRRYPAGTEIVRQGEKGEELFLIKSGRVKVLRDPNRPSGERKANGAGASDSAQRVAVADLQAGDIFGEQALTTGEARNATIVAVTDVEVYTLDKQDFNNAMAASDPFGLEVKRIREERMESQARKLEPGRRE
jgi:putative ABC transport system ATP-binding protein